MFLCSLHPATNQRAFSKLSPKTNFQITFLPRRRTKTMPHGSNRSTNHCHATQQNEKKNSTLVIPNIANYPGMGLRIVLQSGCPKSYAYSTRFTFTNIHAFSRIQTQYLRNSS
ncbi:hypothetical protein TNCV_3275011 [Trichonephila clavipes]|nr:hypothetical protein TNCV_3275011 [Trichonephila clavipes]